MILIQKKIKHMSPGDVIMIHDQPWILIGFRERTSKPSQTMFNIVGAYITPKNGIIEFMYSEEDIEFIAWDNEQC